MMKSRKITIEESFYNVIGSIMISALIFYLINVITQEFIADWDSTTENLNWALMIGYIVAIIVSIFVNYQIMKKTTPNRVIFSFVFALFLTVLIETIIGYLYLLYAVPDLEIDISIALVFRIIFTASELFFDNVTYLWVISQAIFAIFLNLLLYRLNKQEKVKSTNPYGQPESKYTDLIEGINEESDFAESSFSLVYQIIKAIFAVLSFGLLYFYWIQRLDTGLKKFMLIFCVYALCHLFSAWIAYWIYRKMGSKKYKELNPRSKQRYYRNIISTVISTLANFFLINSFLFANVNTIGELFIYLIFSTIVIFLISDYLAILILK